MTSATLSKQALRHLEGGRFGKAAELAERAVTADPTNSEGWIVRGAALGAQGDRKGSRQAYGACVRDGRGPHVAECKRLLR